MLSSQSTISSQANALRKEKKYEEALNLYYKAWSQERGAMAGAGLLHCLRKLGRFNEAFKIAQDLSIYIDLSTWVKNEIVWTYIDGQFRPLVEEGKSDEVLTVVEKIFAYKPDQLAREFLVLRLCRLFKKEEKWDLLLEWCNRIDPEVLSSDPANFGIGKKGWSNQALWYHYKIAGLLGTKKFVDSLELCENAVERFPSQRKFFLRDKAVTHLGLKKYQEAVADYKQLCITVTCDWWLLAEYGRALWLFGEREQALSIACQAAISCKQPQMLVNHLETISEMFVDLGDIIAARDNLALSAAIRKEGGWKVSHDTEERLNSFNKQINDGRVNDTVLSLNVRCHKNWLAIASNCSINSLQQGIQNDLDSDKKSCIGVVSLGYEERPYCFIHSEDGTTYFCRKMDLPVGVKDNDVLLFDAYPSWDKKKDKEGWKARNIMKR